jgi:hypothetical protein
MEPAQVVRELIEALQVPPYRIPAGPEAQAGLYRSLLAGKQMLILLDNARDADQVGPLLPGGPGPVVLVTSRNQLAGLVTATGARLVTLAPLPGDEAWRLLAHRLSHDRVAAEPDATAEIIMPTVGLAVRPAARLPSPMVQQMRATIKSIFD